MTVHLAVLLFGLSGLFGKLITLPAIIITLGRVFFSSLFLLCLLKVRKVSLKPQSRLDAVVLASAGAVLALHWWSFLASIQVSTVATATISFSTFPLFVTLLSPFFFKGEDTFKGHCFGLSHDGGRIYNDRKLGFR